MLIDCGQKYYHHFHHHHHHNQHHQHHCHHNSGRHGTTSVEHHSNGNDGQRQERWASRNAGDFFLLPDMHVWLAQSSRIDWKSWNFFTSWKNEILNVFLFDLVTLTTSGWIHRPDMCSSLPNSLGQVVCHLRDHHHHPSPSPSSPSHHNHQDKHNSYHFKLRQKLMNQLHTRQPGNLNSSNTAHISISSSLMTILKLPLD